MRNYQLTFHSSYHSWLIVALIWLFIMSGLTLFVGDTPWQSVWQGINERLFNGTSNWNPLLDERIPRLIVLICTGASLAVCGAMMQSLFHNPLASPSILGISSGGCLSVILVFIYQLYHSYPFFIPLAAFLGCFLTLCLVYGLAKFQHGKYLTNLILTGIAISTLLISVQGLILYALRDHWQLIQTITEWEAGSLNDRHWQHVHMQLPLTLIGLMGCWYYRSELNLLALGEEEATHLGVDVKLVRRNLFFCIALLTGGVLAAVGVIPFFGLILPHLIRRLFGCNHFIMIPFCIIGGAGVFILMDLILRVFDLHNISIGNLSAVIGGLFFLYLLFKPQPNPSQSI
ncbi:MAG: iron ABC transporter permease [Parachlamydiaceae bacterium]|nr:iron ABC transporter permease [Parachlamydiaceae bacterium]